MPDDVHPDIKFAWEEMVRKGLISGDPKYYWDGSAEQYEVDHAQNTAMLSILSRVEQLEFVHKNPEHHPIIPVPPPPPENQPPEAYAGGNFLVETGKWYKLGATATDDGLPDPPAELFYTWGVIKSPVGSDAEFTDATQLAPEVRFSKKGQYTLRLVVTDTEASVHSDALVTVSAEPPGSWGDGVPFLDRPEYEGQYQLNGAGDVVIENYKFTNRPYLFDGTNRHVCVLLSSCRRIVVRNCDFDTVGQPIAIVNGGAEIVTEYCRARNITGPSARHGVQSGNFIQTVGGPRQITVQHNKILGGDTEDIISLFSASDSVVRKNEIQGARPDLIDGGWTSASGTGIILGDGGGADSCVAEDNKIYLPGQVGVAIAGGTRMISRRNIVYQLTQLPRANSNVGMYALNYYGQPFGDHLFQDNRVKFWSDGGNVWNGVYNPGNARDEGNNWNDDTIDPAELEVVL